MPRPSRAAAYLPVALAAAAVVSAGRPAAAATWDDLTATTIGATAEWSNKVEIADVDGDGDLDLLFANGGEYDAAGEAEPLRVFAGDGAGGFAEITADVFGDARFLARSVKVGDVSGDGVPDVVVGTTYQTQSRLFVGGVGGGFTDRTEDLPAAARSIGDLELGDVDGDGDLDIALADWGAGRPTTNDGGQPRLWLNDGAGRFDDVTAERLPARLIGMSWDLELVDVDNDRDLDLLVSSKTSSGGVLLINDGAATYVDGSARLPQFTNDYEFEAMDLDGDAVLDLVTINDGPALTEHVLRGDGVGFVDATAAWLAPAANPEWLDDNAAVFLDADDDGDADVLIGSLGDGAGDDRVLINAGDGHLTLGAQRIGGAATPGTLGIAVADLDGDGRLDVVQAQGEAAFDDRLFLAGAAAPIDGTPPAIVELGPDAVDRTREVVVRVHDHRTPVRSAELAVELREIVGGTPRVTPMRWSGEGLFRAAIAPPPGAEADEITICATDARGNQACTTPRTVTLGAAADAGPDGGVGATDGDDAGCGCRGAGRSGGWLGGALLLAIERLRRRRGRDHTSARRRG